MTRMPGPFALAAPQTESPLVRAGLWAALFSSLAFAAGGTLWAFWQPPPPAPRVASPKPAPLAAPPRVTTRAAVPQPIAAPLRKRPAAAPAIMLRPAAMPPVSPTKDVAAPARSKPSRHRSSATRHR